MTKKERTGNSHEVAVAAGDHVGGPAAVEEQLRGLLDDALRDPRLLRRGQHVGRADQLHRVAERRPGAGLRQLRQRLVGQLHLFYLGALLQDLRDLRLTVLCRLHYEHPVQQIARDAMGRLNFCPADIRYTSVGGEDTDGSERRL